MRRIGLKDHSEHIITKAYNNKKHTGVGEIFLGILTSNLDVNKINLQFLISFYTNQEWRTTTSGDHFIRKVR
jgi:hypothetical protein